MVLDKYGNKATRKKEKKQKKKKDAQKQQNCSRNRKNDLLNDSTPNAQSAISKHTGRLEKDRMKPQTVASYHTATDQKKPAQSHRPVGTRTASG